MTEVEIIQGVIDLLSKPGAWVKHVRGLTADYRGVNPPDVRAISFCLGGAVQQVTGMSQWDGWLAHRIREGDPVANRFNALARTRGFDDTIYGYSCPFVEFNNAPETTHEDVMMFLKEALYDAQAEKSARHIKEMSVDV